MATSTNNVKRHVPGRRDIRVISIDVQRVRTLTKAGRSINNNMTGSDISNVVSSVNTSNRTGSAQGQSGSRTHGNLIHGDTGRRSYTQISCGCHLVQRQISPGIDTDRESERDPAGTIEHAAQRIGAGPRVDRERGGRVQKCHRLGRGTSNLTDPVVHGAGSQCDAVSKGTKREDAVCYDEVIGNGLQPRVSQR